jgi:hypothetical protein
MPPWPVYSAAVFAALIQSYPMPFDNLFTELFSIFDVYPDMRTQRLNTAKVRFLPSSSFEWGTTFKCLDGGSILQPYSMANSFTP